ncbi:MAG: nucleotidyltransferase domain-containing protein [Saprospiraceae bacterium]|nr:nucleotidyltransferase domain-containing protein [Saprospiraceae bacterium]MCB9325029.1 nucleotidyltransferase domain-containing protein [Lewinellaceae bacterium]
MKKSIIQNDLINELKERAKELNCLYQIQELLSDLNLTEEEISKGIIKVIPQGWQYPEICTVKITYRNSVFQSPDYKETSWVLESDVIVQDEKLGNIQVFYTEERPVCDYGPFLKEEKKLIKTISDLMGAYYFHKQLKSVFEEEKLKSKEKKPEWRVILDMLKKTDPKLLIRISRKMVNYLCWKGITEGEKLFDFFNPTYAEESGLYKEANFPYQAKTELDSLILSNEIFEITSKHLNEQEIIDCIGRWIKQDQSGFLVNVINNDSSTTDEINSVLERYHHLKIHGLELTPIRAISLRITLSRRLLSDQKKFIKVAKDFIGVDDYYNLLSKVIYPNNSHGKLGGKSSGLFLSENILKKSKLSDEFAKRFKIPNTWYITSDGILKFMKFNNLEDIVEQKHKDIEQIRKEYSYVSHVFKNSSFPPEMTKALSAMLDDFGNYPLIIRSTSLLEDRYDAVFAGKYKSLFISNQGSKMERLSELTDAIAEVYASTFGPDPIEYRLERDLIYFHEEMAIMIQEVVGKRVGDYFFPAFAGVAFSQNNYRWSSRIKQEDGLIRLVPGLGTRAVDRLSDDYPVLIAPGKPNLRANVAIDEIVRYSPKKLDVINLEKRSFETIKIDKLLKEHGKEYPIINQIVSKISENYIQQVRRLGMNFEKENYVVTFNDLVNNTDFIKQINATLSVLQKELGYPVDIEFAHNGEDFYLLQCRPQSYGKVSKPATIPFDIPKEKLIFSANKYITNGMVSNITHVVYVDPEQYGKLSNYEELAAVGRAIGRLNKLLPKRQFILLGPGRWGSRGDIKLGVSVTYSEINNTAVLIEIARKLKDYVPELSFGTHFFQDLVEANILYLPLYPDEFGNTFNESFFTDSPNILSSLFPDLNSLSGVIKVIDISTCTGGNSLKILMNGDENKAVAVLEEKSIIPAFKEKQATEHTKAENNDFHWRWRLEAAEKIASKMNPERFGVKNFYVFGSTKNATASQGSDIDILIHFQGTEDQRNNLLSWLEGWGTSLEYNYFIRTGYKISGLLDIHIVTDEDIKNRTSFAIKIGAITDAARPLPIGLDI